MQIAETFFALLRTKFGSAEWDNRCLSEEELKQLFSLAKAHDLTPIIASVLADLNLIPPNIAANHQLHAVWRYEKLNHELEQISRVLENAGIDYLPLKGSVIRPVYPEPWMRTSCDIDILVHEEDLDRMTEVLMGELNYTLDQTGGLRHIWMHAPNGIHLEPHYSLHENSDRLDRVLDEVWENSSVEDGYRHRYKQSPEFLLFHLIVHMAGHFQHGGCGVKPFIDLYLLDHQLNYDRDKLADFCRRAGVEKFCRCVRQVIAVWFGGAPHTDVTQRIEEYVLSGGVYGTRSNQVAVVQERAGNKFQHILTRIFMPYKSLKIKYPILAKHRWLTPVYQVVRWVQMLQKGRWGTYRRELDLICGLDDQRRAEIGQLLDDVGL